MMWVHNLQVAVHSHGGEEENAGGPASCNKEELHAAEDLSEDPVLAPDVVVCTEWHEEQQHCVGHCQVCQVDGVWLPAFYAEGKHAEGQNVSRETKNEF